MSRKPGKWEFWYLNVFFNLPKGKRMYWQLRSGGEGSPSWSETNLQMFLETLSMGLSSPSRLVRASSLAKKAKGFVRLRLWHSRNVTSAKFSGSKQATTSRLNEVAAKIKWKRGARREMSDDYNLPYDPLIMVLGLAIRWQANCPLLPLLLHVLIPKATWLLIDDSPAKLKRITWTSN